MGQTLSHGVYLPNEGERNCYAGLASNWQILNTAVGNIAEKAPLVHTHGNITNDGKVGTAANKPLITGTGGVVQAGAFGNQANTFCEGNDSRLSDARTPVAHTHVTADVTDLLSGNHTWTGDNTFSKAVGFTKVNATTFYAQNSRAGLGETNLSGDTYTQISFEDKNGDNFGYLRQTYGADGTNVLNIFVRNKFLNGVPNTAGTVDYAYFGIILGADKSKEAVFKANLRPYDSTNAYNLGDSTYKWKTFNGINPGALSLPDTLGTSGTENVNYFNVIGYLNNTGTLATIPTTATYDGWLYINAKDGADSYIIVDDSPSSFGTSVFGNNGLGAQSIGLLCLMCPIRKGHSYNVRIKSAGIVSARIYPAQGNV